MTQIKEALLDFNPWWKEQFTMEFKEREIYTEVLKFLPMPQMIALTGLRRVGKTTIMLKTVNDFIQKGFEPKNVIYFSFDEFAQSGIRDIIKEYEALVGKSFKSGKYLLLLDEIQKLAGWENQLKSIYDLFGKNIKILLSGSESLFIRKQSKETLAGRLFEFKVEPLNFREFLQFKEANLAPTTLYGKELSQLFDEFTLTLGFPELVGIAEKAIIKKYINESILEKVVFRDLALLLGVKDMEAMQSLIKILTEEPGQLIDLSDLAKELKITRQTVSNYLTYLEQSFLLRKLYNFSRNKRKTERKLKKYYPTLISADLLFREDELSKSKVFEWMVINQLKAEYFWRDPYKNEVDAVIASNGITPVEVKYGKIDFNGLLAFMKKFGIEKGCIISRGTEEKQCIGGRTILTVPAYKFLLER